VGQAWFVKWRRKQNPLADLRLGDLPNVSCFVPSGKEWDLGEQSAPINLPRTKEDS
jgi:hypothetical protein